MRYFILIFKSHELICCWTCFRGLAPRAAEELCSHFSSQRKPCFISGALRALWTAKCDRDLALARKVAMSVMCILDVFGTKPASTDTLVLMASCVWCCARAVMGKLSLVHYSALPNWRLNMLVETQGKPETAFPECCYLLQRLLSIWVLVSCLLCILCQGPLISSFVDSAGCNGDRKELRGAVIRFKTLAHEQLVWQAIVSISCCSDIAVRYQS